MRVLASFTHYVLLNRSNLRTVQFHVSSQAKKTSNCKVCIIIINIWPTLLPIYIDIVLHIEIWCTVCFRPETTASKQLSEVDPTVGNTTFLQWLFFILNGGGSIFKLYNTKDWKLWAKKLNCNDCICYTFQEQQKFSMSLLCQVLVRYCGDFISLLHRIVVIPYTTRLYHAYYNM